MVSNFPSQSQSTHIIFFWIQMCYFFVICLFAPSKQIFFNTNIPMQSQTIPNKSSLTQMFLCTLKPLKPFIIYNKKIFNSNLKPPSVPSNMHGRIQSIQSITQLPYLWIQALKTLKSIPIIYKCALLHLQCSNLQTSKCQPMFQMCTIAPSNTNHHISSSKH